MSPERAAAPGSTPGTTAKTTASPLTSSEVHRDRTDASRTPRRCMPGPVPEPHLSIARRWLPICRAALHGEAGR